MKAYELKTDGLNNPVGISASYPHLSWKLEAQPDVYNKYQSAYRIVCADSPDHLAEEQYLWDSGKVQSTKSYGIKCPLAVKSRQRIYWTVAVWDENDVTDGFAECAYYEQGLLTEHDWKAKWIDPELEIDAEQRQPASYLQKSFQLSEDIRKARLYITACGLYSCRINGRPVTNQVLTPGTTQYNKRLQVQTYDVSSLLQKGENTIAVTLGDGWFRGMNGMQRNRNLFGEYISLLAQLEISLTSGNELMIGTDESWKATQNGPIRFSDPMQGERYDANLALGSRDQTDHDDVAWHAVTVRELGFANLIGSNSFPVLEHEHFQAVLLYQDESGSVLDFGQNLSGYVSFSLPGGSDAKGAVITLEHGEALDGEGRFSMDNLEANFDPNTPPLLQKIVYTASGEENQFYKPLFSTFGFRYVKVTGWPGPIDPACFTAYAVYSDVSKTADFTCSNELINRLVQNTVWSLKGNFVDVPTDCPHRERAGYTGDAQVFINTGAMLADSLPFYRKWLADLRATQDETGKISNIAPMQQKEFAYFDGSAGWGDALVIIPYMLFHQFGDKQILEENYSAMKAWVDYELREARNNNPKRTVSYGRYEEFVWDTDRHWGEWMEPGQTMDYIMDRLYNGCPETATAYMFYSCKLLARISTWLQKDEDAAYYSGQAKIIREAYQTIFLSEAFESKRQCLCVRPLFMGLADESQEKLLAERLNQLLVETEYHVNTGFLSTPFVCQVLTEHGYTDTAFRLLEQEECPGWLYPVKMGATTIWERWDSIREDGSIDGSLNHYSYGAIVGWLLQYVAGIRPIENGYDAFLVAPQPGGSLTEAKARFDCVHGRIMSAWKLEGKQMLIEAVVPVNTSCTIRFPANDYSRLIACPENVKPEQDEQGIYCKVGSGIYHFALKI